MVEHYGLSEAQKSYLKSGKRLSNTSKERKAIMRKALQAWSVLKPILDSKTIESDFKYFPFISKPIPSEFERLDIPKDQYNFSQFLASLLSTNKENPTSQEIEKMAIAKEIIESSIGYYQTRFSNHELVYSKFSEFRDFISMLQGVYEQELNNIVKADFVRIRKGLIFPPIVQQDEHWHSYCNLCFSYSLNVHAKTKEKAIEEAKTLIKHSDDCQFVKEYEQVKDKQGLIINCIHFIEPKTK